MAIHFSPVWIAASITAIVFALIYPLILAFLAWKRLHVGWQYFSFGALIFFVFQVQSATVVTGSPRIDALYRRIR